MENRKAFPSIGISLLIAILLLSSGLGFSGLGPTFSSIKVLLSKASLEVGDYSVAFALSCKKPLAPLF